MHSIPTYVLNVEPATDFWPVHDFNIQVIVRCFWFAITLFKFPPQCSAINSDQKSTTDDGKPQLKRTKDAAHWNLGLYEPSWRLRLDLKSIRSSLSIATSCDVCDACPTHRDKRDAIVFIPTAVAISLILGFLDREPGFWQGLQKNHAPCHLQPEVGGSLQAVTVSVPDLLR